MRQELFDALIKVEHQKSLDLLNAKAKEYAQSGGDRLINFKRCAAMREINPADALAGMLVKHFDSLLVMCKDPLTHSIEKWDEKLVDVRNYTYLLKALIVDMRNEKQL
jgi:hypothetical protein